MNTFLRQTALPGGVDLQLVQGDLTEERVDAIVNAANAHLQHGGGVAGAISHRGGPQIQAESDAWVRQHGPVRHAEPAHTSGGALPCRYVIHAVGPVWGEGDEDAKLAAAVSGSLRSAERLGLRSIALPAISTGIYGFPKGRAARVMLGALRDYFSIPDRGEASLELARLVLFDRATVEAFQGAWDEIFAAT
jgi:O-acetyl-ADP-ribose deacetylase (regulator of RNase III)